MKNNIRTLILSGMLAVIALLLSFFSFAVPFLPPFLKFDFTFIPLFLALFLAGYKNSLLTSFLKNLLFFLLISSEPTGIIANLVVEFIFLTVIALFYKKNNLQIIVGGIIGTLAITFFMSLLNYFILLPAYGYIMNLSDIVSNIKTIVTIGIVPFNIIKGTLLIFLFFLTRKIYNSIPNTIKNKYTR